MSSIYNGSKKAIRFARFFHAILVSLLFLLLATSCGLPGLSGEENDDSTMMGLLLLGASNGGGGGSIGVAERPENLIVTPGDSEVALSWNPVEGATSYNVYWSIDPYFTKDSGNKIAGVPSLYYHTHLTNGNSYCYIVTSVNSAGESTESAKVSAIPGGGNAATGPVTVPGIPAGLSITAGDGQNILKFNAVSGAYTYNLYWGTGAGITTSTGNKIGAVPTEYTHSGLTNGTTYYYIVTAENNIGESTATSIVSAAPSAIASGGSSSSNAPTGVSATAGLNQVSLSWSAVSGATSYHVYWSTASGFAISTGTKIAGISGTTYTHTGLANGATYYYKVTAEASVWRPIPLPRWGPQERVEMKNVKY